MTLESWPRETEGIGSCQINSHQAAVVPRAPDDTKRRTWTKATKQQQLVAPVLSQPAIYHRILTNGSGAFHVSLILVINH